MKRPNKTDYLLAQALREHMRTMPIDRISVKGITDSCGLNRQTFYYHFRDIYDLAKWTYLQDIEAALAKSGEFDWPHALRVFLGEIDADRACHLALYNSANYYPGLHYEFSEMAASMLGPVFERRLDFLSECDDGYRTFLVQMYSLVLFEFAERRARGIAISTEESFIDHWMRCLADQRRGALALRAAAAGE